MASADPEELLTTLREAERARVAAAHRRLTASLTRARENVAALAALGSPEALLRLGPERMGRGTGFRRLMISRVHDRTLTPLSLWRAGADPRRPAAVPDVRVSLAYPLVEAELAERPQARVVQVAAAGRRTPPELTGALGWSSYAVATLTLDGAPLGILHADLDDAPARALDEVDRVVAELLADGFSAAFEVAALRHAVASHRDVQRAAIRQLAAGLEAPEDRDVGAHGGSGAATAVRDPLTAREREVLDRLARGLTNRAIARELVISEATVKYHVRNLLRKLGATSRADAVSRHLRRGVRNGA